MTRIIRAALGAMVSLLFVAGMSYAGTLSETGKSVGGAAVKGATEGGKSAVKGAVGQIDINSASVEQLKSLPGIGDAYAKKIVEGRPYANKAQLKSKKIIPASVYDKISGMIVAKQPKK